MPVRSICPWLLALLTCLPTADSAEGVRREPFAMHLTAPIKTWDEAVPLGNGLTGGLLWGQGNTINLSLDRGDLWDQRLPEDYLKDDWNYATIKALVAAKNQGEMVRRFDAPYNQVPYPTKLPGGRLVLTLDASQQAEHFTLDMKKASGSVKLAAGRFDVFFSAVEPVAMIRVAGPAPEYKFLRPAGLDRLGYAPAVFGSDGSTTWMVQQAADGLKYAVVVSSKRIGDQTQLAVAITCTNDGDDPLAIGRKRVTAALASGFDAMLAAHLRWWEAFWKTSDVKVPHDGIQHHYNLIKYFYGAASRPDAPPIPLQGVWTRDDGGLPPWKGDFHHDLNTQMTYLAYPTAGLFPAGESFVNYNWNLLPQYRKFAREFYGVQGAAIPGVATLSGKPTAGWAQYALSPTGGLWVGQTFDLHWRYTADREFLARRAYPWLSEVATAVVNLLEERDGKLYLPLSSSPEIYNNSMRAWLPPNSNHDLALIDWTFHTLAEMADALGKTEEAGRWRGLRAKLDAPIVDENDVLCFARGTPFNQSHRHHAHTMAIHPLGTLNVEGSDRDRAIINATLDRMQELKTQAWCGYSFSWFACIAARAARPEMALNSLIDFERAFILRNGFHVNGDQIGAGLSAARYRPFTLEGNFLAMEAVHEMLLQSWGGTVRVFPAVSKQWPDASFENLRAWGGFKVSATRKGGETAQVRIEATVDGTLRLRNPFPARVPRWNLQNVTRQGEDYVVALKKGESIEGHPGQ
ncbi:MAG: glycoside hydrolase N-terminal domain-containing protein [Planctomycetes bacterium]|nr:glycoside hydrolase N-terminal domain-containing protein [Planctomycetota bacterium]